MHAAEATYTHTHNKRCRSHHLISVQDIYEIEKDYESTACAVVYIKATQAGKTSSLILTEIDRHSILKQPWHACCVQLLPLHQRFVRSKIDSFCFRELITGVVKAFEKPPLA